MASNTVGINISMQSNIPQVAKESADALRNMSNASADMQKALSLGGIEAQYKEFADRINKYHDSIQRMQAQTKNSFSGLPNAGSLFRTAGSTVAGLGTTGDVVNAGVGVGDTLASIIKGLGPIGKYIGGGLLAATGVGYAGNALEKVYEKQINTVMKVTAQLDQLGNTSKETSKNFGKVMDDIGIKASKLGMTFEQGAAIFGALTTAGGRGAAVGRAATDVMTYSRLYGADTGTLSRFMGLGLRFGLQGGGAAGIMGYAAGQIKELGMSRAQLGEILQAQSQMIEQGVSRGIIKNVASVNAVQSWIGSMGRQYQGQYGLGLFNKMDMAIAGATGVQSQADIIKYQAVSQLLGGKGSYIDVMKQIERGATVKNINAIKNAIKGMTGGNENNAIELVRRVYDVNYTTASEIWKAPDATSAKKALDESAKAKALKKTPEMELLSEQQKIMTSIRDSAKLLTPIKAGLYGGFDSVLKAIDKHFGIGTTGAEAKKQREAEQRAATARVNKVTQGGFESLLMLGGRPSPGNLLPLTESNQINALLSSASGDFAENIISEWMSSLSDKDKTLLSKNPLLSDALKSAVKSTSEGGSAITLNELSTALTNLTTQLEKLETATKEHTEEVKKPIKVDIPKGYGIHSYGRF